MIFVDTNVFMYAAGAPHPLRTPARSFFDECRRLRRPICTSAEVVQELLHVYIPVARTETFAATLTLIRSLRVEVWPLEFEDVVLASELEKQAATLKARDLCHLASCRRRGVKRIKTFDRALEAASVLLR